MVITEIVSILGCRKHERLDPDRISIRDSKKNFFLLRFSKFSSIIMYDFSNENNTFRF